MLPSGVKNIGNSAFGQCQHLQWANLRAARNLQQMGQGVFSECGELKHVLLGDGLKSISDSCFLECGLEEITIPCGVESIESAVF